MTDLNAQVTPLRRETLQGSVFSRLCELILQGGIAPGEKIAVASLAKAFGVSPMPVREALTRLSAAGAVSVLSGRTIGIPELTRERLDDLRRVRLEVDTIAAEWAAERTDARFIKELETYFSKLLEAQNKNDTKLYIEANYGFHFCIYRQAQSPTLYGIMERLWLQVSPYLHLLRELGNFTISNRFHQQLFDALSAGDKRLARAAMRDDLNQAYESLTCLLH